MILDPPGRSSEEGFVLLVALIALVALSALATGGVWVSSSGFLSTEAFSTGRRAFNAADAGLQQYLGTYGATPPGTVNYDFGDGEEATVRVTRVRQDPDVYHVEATGTVKVNGTEVASRTVGTAASVHMGPMPQPPSAMYSPNGIEKSGGSGTISGLDSFDPTDAGVPTACQGMSPEDKNGVVVPPDGYTQSSGDLIPEGSPHDTLTMPQDQMLDSLNLDWQSVIDGEAVEFDYTVDPDDTSGWPDFDDIGSDEFPVIYVGGDGNSTVTLDSNDSGHGVIISRGNLTFNGSFSWEGLIYAGGELTAGNGDQTVTGAMMSGLNMLIGETVEDADVLDGTKNFQFNSCSVFRAMSAMSHFETVPGSWYQGAETN